MHMLYVVFFLFCCCHYFFVNDLLRNACLIKLCVVLLGTNTTSGFIKPVFKQDVESELQDGWMVGWTNRKMDGWKDGWKDGLIE